MLASNRSRSEMLLSSLSAQDSPPPPQRRIIQSPMSVVVRSRNPDRRQHLPVSPAHIHRALQAPVWSFNLLFLSVNRQQGMARYVRKACSVKEKGQGRAEE